MSRIYLNEYATLSEVTALKEATDGNSCLIDHMLWYIYVASEEFRKKTLLESKLHAVIPQTPSSTSQ